MTETWIDTAITAIRKSSPESKIYVGCDSVRFKKKLKGEDKSRWFARYSVVIVLHNSIGSITKGCSLFHNTFVESDYSIKGDCKLRMMREAQEAIEVGVKIREAMGINDPRSIQIHLDINPSKMYASSVAVSEALGWATGMGFDAKIKPEAFAASYAADRVANR